MKREISLWVEWAWMKGLLNHDRQSIDASAQTLALALKKQFPQRFGSLQTSVDALSHHIEGALKILSYGQRKPDSLHPQRRAYLENLPFVLTAIDAQNNGP
jgi:hypothetical protein